MRRIAVLTIAVVAFAAPASASAATKTVDMGLPLSQQQKFSALSADVDDFFPHGVTIHAGDSVRFVPTGFHTVDLPSKGGKAQPLLVTGSAITGALDAAGNPFWFNGQKSLNFNPVVAGATGLGRHFSYTGAKRVLSGLPLNAHPKPMTVKFTKAGSYTYYCDVHPGMKGTVRVLPKRKAIPSARRDKAALNKQVSRALAVARTITNVTGVANTVDVGLKGAHSVEYFGFLPATLTVPVGSVVTFRMPVGSQEVHTATTGPGNPDSEPDSYLGALSASVVSPKINPAALYPSDPPPNPAGLTPASHGNGFWSSGAMDALSATPQPSAGAVRFDAPGTYQFYCLIHPFMHGTVVVQ